MSGGAFEYKQRSLLYISEDIQEHLDNQGKEVIGWKNNYYGKQEIEYYESYSIEVNNVFEEAKKKLKEAYIYAQRIDWYLSGDDGEESLHRRLKEDLEKLKE